MSVLGKAVLFKGAIFAEYLIVWQTIKRELIMRTTLKFIYLITLSIIILALSCGVPQADYDKLKIENDRLQTELDECKFGAEKIVAVVENAYAEKNYTLAQQNIEMLYDKHPESPKNEEFKKLSKTIKKKEEEEKRKKEAEEKERIRLANLNNTGMWSIGNFVDGFGEPTKNRFITNTIRIRGTFSNTATEDSKLDIRFLISNSSEISMQLYEYAGNNPVKTMSIEIYFVDVQDNDINKLELYAENTFDRLIFNKESSRKLHNALMKGGTLKFWLINGSRSQYQFTIMNADWYENAYRILKES